MSFHVKIRKRVHILLSVSSVTKIRDGFSTRKFIDHLLFPWYPIPFALTETVNGRVESGDEEESKDRRKDNKRKNITSRVDKKRHSRKTLRESIIESVCSCLVLVMYALQLFNRRYTDFGHVLV